MKLIFRTALVTALLAGTPAAWAACRVTDFSDRPLSSLSEPQRLAFASQMLQTEYTRLRAVSAGDANHYPLIAGVSSYNEARAKAKTKFDALGLEFSDDQRRLMASEWLDDAGLAKFGNCVSSRQPGLLALGRREAAGKFHLTIVHVTPIGVEKISTQLIASSNVANAAALEAFLTDIGPQDNYTAKLFPVQIADPAKRTVIVLRAGWETPRYVVIPPITAAGAK